MSAQLKPREDLPRILHEWAEWAIQAEAAGYPSSDSLWRAQFARGGQPETVPAGIWKLWANPDVRWVHRAMESLMPQFGEQMRFVQAFHRVGPAPMVSLGLTYPEITGRLEEGYKLLRKVMRIRA